MNFLFIFGVCRVRRMYCPKHIIYNRQALWGSRWGVLEGGEETINVECHLWNLLTLSTLGKSFSSFFKDIVFQKIYQPNMGKLESIFGHTKHTVIAT